MTQPITDKPPIVDRGFVEKFMISVDRPLDYGVYFLINDWWETATQDAIDAYMEELYAIPGAEDFLREGHIAEPMVVEDLKDYAPGTLGAAYRDFVVENNLMKNFGTDYRKFQKELMASGKLSKMPEEMAYMSVRGTQLHDFMHVLTGYGATIPGELALASYYLSQIRSPYHAIRLAVVMTHTALVAPKGNLPAMDAFVDGWYYGRNSMNINFEKWEERLGEPLSALQSEMNLRQIAKAA
ncbi:MAG: Coq4 family protein [Henriciella sp.]|nr:Coq4 family protein [Henriciella sp.]